MNRPIADKLVRLVGDHILELIDGMDYDDFKEIIEINFGDKEGFIQEIDNLITDSDDNELLYQVFISLTDYELTIFDDECDTDYNQFYRMVKSYCGY